MNDLAQLIAVETEIELEARPLRWNIDLTIPAFLLKTTFTELVQDRAAELLTNDCDYPERCREICSDTRKYDEREMMRIANRRTDK